VEVEPRAPWPAAVGLKVQKGPPRAAVEPAVELDEDYSGCRSAGGQEQG